MKTFLLILNFTLGITIFWLGLRLLGTTLESVLGFRLRSLLTRLTSTKGRSLVAGLVCTCLVQSSSAVGSTMVILVDSGVLNLGQAFGVMLGANIGTTLTAQIIAFPLERAALPLIGGGLLLTFALKRRVLGRAVFGLGSIFFGLTFTTAVLAPLLSMPILQYALLDLTDTPWQACLLGFFLTALVQSSSAVTGLVIGLARYNLLPLSSAVGVALGSNVGTVVTTLLASIGRSQASRATALADLLFNLGGVLLILPFYSAFLRLVGLLSGDIARQVAHAHTLFNVITALLALPFLDYLARLAWRWAGIWREDKN